MFSPVLRISRELKRKEKEEEKEGKAREKAERAKAIEAKKIMKEKVCSGQKSAHGKQKENKTGANVTFTDSELSKFSKAYKEGYDIKTNERYNLWLKTFHSKEKNHSKSGMSHCIMCVYANVCVRQTLKHVCTGKSNKNHTVTWTTSYSIHCCTCFTGRENDFACRTVGPGSQMSSESDLEQENTGE